MDTISSLSMLNLMTDTVQNNTVGSESGVNSEGKTFAETMTDALNSVNNDISEVTRLSELALVQPDDVDVHEVTIAIAQANMSLSLAKNVIDSAVDAYKEILTLR